MKNYCNYCDTHNEPKNIITDSYGKICIKCYLDIIKKKPKKKRKVDNQLTIFDALNC